MEKLQDVARGQASLMRAEASYLAANFWRDEDGDTNFVSILILLGIALGVAAVFLAFRDRIINWLNGQMNMFSSRNAATVTTTYDASTQGKPA